MANAGGPAAIDMAPGEAEQPIEYFPPLRPWIVLDGTVRLQGMRCPSCGALAFPPRMVCHACGQTGGMETATLAGNGKLYSHSEVHTAPKGFSTPYTIGFVDLDDGVRILGQLEHRAADVAIGDDMVLVEGVIRIRPNGTRVVSYKFRKRSA